MLGERTMTLLQLQQQVGRVIAASEAARDVWVTAELSDVRVSGGHCYMELLQKDDSGRTILAKARAIIWSGAFRTIGLKFFQATGRQLATGLKVLVRVSATLHPVYGFSLQISDIDPSYTMGDLERLRREIIERLRREGILDQNRTLEWPHVAQRVAVISAPGAAGYGDFINQLLGNSARLRFDVRLFEAVMQGASASASVIDALGRIAADSVNWDCVVIIRGGGASSDLSCFDNYELAAAIAMYHLPVIVGIGHNRDVTVLDSVANMCVKTPTAAAEILIDRSMAALNRLRELGSAIAFAASEKCGGCRQRLAFLEGLLPVLPQQSLERRRVRLSAMAAGLGAVAGKIGSSLSRLDTLSVTLQTSARSIVERRSARLDALGEILDALSPEATLRRGYSITRFNGRALTSAAGIAPGAEIETIMADGSIKSVVK